jgi:hypothetical protein
MPQMPNVPQMQPEQDADNQMQPIEAPQIAQDNTDANAENYNQSLMNNLMNSQSLGTAV